MGLDWREWSHDRLTIWKISGVLALGIATVTFAGFALGQARPLPASVASDYTPPAVPSPVLTSSISVAVIGDSYTAGSAMNAGEEWTTLVRGLNDIRVDRYAVGGTGYAATREMSYGESNFQTRVARLPADIENLAFFGSINDGRMGYQATYEAALATYEAAEARWPGARILSIGPASPTWPVPEEISTSRDAVRAASEQSGIAFVDPIEEGWFSDRPDLIGADGIHPTDAGHQYLAERIGSTLASQFPIAP